MLLRSAMEALHSHSLPGRCAAACQDSASARFMKSVVELSWRGGISGLSLRQHVLAIKAVWLCKGHSTAKGVPSLVVPCA